MCAIAGLIGPGANSTAIDKMLLASRHRSPDATGVWQHKDVLLGHNRLTILDLSDAANRPMIDSETGVAISFNGEIYN